ncbi:hypothetical protein GobsT_63260 [Gemmata obscuriglobus]|uniref:Uncharacterized protein n=1 Tax=Gemmata obscuriglobus TaxID=114 RepID=A0A2Z3GNV9_9BACT|nr:hypothetical protein [Gemmata obscuriglobus]AWM35939.1 hypothetical protein C1280_02195 [Gemmata obscuriglobus]QEG31504.1 hypothetical protein GobsT_63260 [Gemmata obscuriglobus]VTS10846.1 unnamed protein product [Gemmata obscuriglobus UQM 2246]
MPGKSPTQRIDDLTARVRDLEAALDTYQKVTDLALKTIEGQVSDRAKVEDELRNKVVELAVKNAALEERARGQKESWEERARTLEKNADRGWQLWLAALRFGFGLISLLVTAALQLKK